MSPNDENARRERADAAGTDEEYFELLEGRRRVLAEKRSENASAGTREDAQPRQRDAGQMKVPPRGAQTPQTPRQQDARPTTGQARATQMRSSTRPSQTQSVQTGSSTRPTQKAQQAQASQQARTRTQQAAPRQSYPRAPLSEAEERRRAEARRRAEEEARRVAAEKAAAREAAARAAAEKRAAEERRRAEEAKRQKEIRRRIREKKRAELAARAMAAGENLLLFFVIFMIVCATALSVFVIYLARTARADENDERGFTYIVDESRSSLDRDEVVFDGVVYVDFTGIAELCGVGVSGVSDELVFEASGGETAVFTPGSDCARVNGNPVTLEGAALMREGRLWLPLSFVRECFVGADAELTEVEKRNRKYLVITVSRAPAPEATGALGSYIASSFRLKAGDTLSGILPYDTPGIQTPQAETAPTYEFTADLSAYERYMSPDVMTRDSYLVLVNKTDRLTYRYMPAALTTVPLSRDTEDPVTLCLYAAKSLEALLTEAASAGFSSIRAASGYVSYDDAAALFDSCLTAERNYSRQNYAATGKRFSDRAYSVLGGTYLSENYIQKGNYTLSLADARRVVSSYLDEPGTDEHQTGLAVDLADTSPAAGNFADSAFYTWLCENAHKFGFVIRYPADKTDATGHDAEPWHLRYVGRYHAAKMYKSGACLEEYLAAIDNAR